MLKAGGVGRRGTERMGGGGVGAGMSAEMAEGREGEPGPSSSLVPALSSRQTSATLLEQPNGLFHAYD